MRKKCLKIVWIGAVTLGGVVSPFSHCFGAGAAKFASGTGNGTGRALEITEGFRSFELYGSASPITNIEKLTPAYGVNPTTATSSSAAVYR